MTSPPLWLPAKSGTAKQDLGAGGVGAVGIVGGDVVAGDGVVAGALAERAV